MSDHPENSPDDSREQPMRGEVRYSQVSARVPEEVGDGCFSNGVLVLTGPFEFVLDFVMRLSESPRVVARVVLPPPVVGQFVQALRQNIANYESRFGPLPQPPKMAMPSPSAAPAGRSQPGEMTPAAPPSPGFQGIAGEGFESETPPVAPARPAGESDSAGPPIDQIYDDLRLPDSLLSGRYANAVLIRHSGTEFCFDFITHIYPRSAVSSRVYIAAANVQSLLMSLSRSFEQYRPRDQP